MPSSGTDWVIQRVVVEPLVVELLNRGDKYVVRVSAPTTPQPTTEQEFSEKEEADAVFETQVIHLEDVRDHIRERIRGIGAT